MPLTSIKLNYRTLQRDLSRYETIKNIEGYGFKFTLSFAESVFFALCFLAVNMFTYSKRLNSNLIYNSDLAYIPDFLKPFTIVWSFFNLDIIKYAKHAGKPKNLKDLENSGQLHFKN